MARNKILIFAVVTVVLALLGLSFVSSHLGELSGVQMTERLGWGQVLFETSGRLAQSYRTAALSVAASEAPLVEAAATLKDGTPASALAEPVRKAVPAAFERLPAPLRRASFFLIGNEKGVLVIPSEGGQPETRAEAFKLSAAGLAGPQGTTVVADGKIYRIAAAPLRVLEAGGEKTVGWLGAAFPLDDVFAAETAKDLQMSVTLLASGVAATSLPAAQKATAGAVKDGRVAPANPPGFGPIFTGGAALAQAKSFPLESAEGAQVVLVSEAASLITLADFQWRALFGVLALALLAVGLVAFGNKGEAHALEQPLPAKPEPSLADLQREQEEAEKATRAAEAAFGEAANAAPPPPPLAVKPEPMPEPIAAPPATEPVAVPLPAPIPAPASNSFDDFPFGATPAPTPEPLPPAEPPPPADPFPFGSAAQEMVEKPFDPFAAALAQSAPIEENNTSEATVTAAVPEELLRAAARPVVPQAQPIHAVETTVVSQVPEELLRAAARRSAAATSPEESHFQEVFQQFVALRAQCNEAADGLTFEKFSAKLRKNRDSLIQKYNCKSVRFQVYVKDGKAALKATPVRE